MPFHCYYGTVVSYSSLSSGFLSIFSFLFLSQEIKEKVPPNEDISAFLYATSASAVGILINS